MSNHIVKVLQTFYITHDVKSFIVEKPENYNYIPGQATDVAIKLDNWEKEFRPFTFTSLAEDKYLQFMVKIYRDHEGVTKTLEKTNIGHELIIQEPFGTLQYQGKGTFIAAGTGITPFLAIFRALYKQNKLFGNKLIYTNKTSKDVIADEELKKMFRNEYLKVYTRENIVGFKERRIDRNFLIDYITNFNQHFYVCGPSDFVKNITTLLIELGANPESMVIEE
ncbi:MULTISPECIES: FAD-binding oxidoreductase [unclassified Flavobacterium]|uniref:FAD-binding oxidoreductase n=1 Tax=unclassified Flavobacterium TaxID=196869 RepID=UPI003616FA6F